MTRRLMLLLLLSTPCAAQHPRDAEIHDADTKAWWHTTEALSGDSMEGRDTGTDAYQRAADYVAQRFKAAGLKPAGENGGYFQTVPMQEIDLDTNKSSVTLMSGIGHLAPKRTSLALLKDITVNFAAAPPIDTDGALVFRGYCDRKGMQDVAGKAVICFGTQRAGLPSGAERVANAKAAGAVAVVNVDDPYFNIEPPRWPYAYARSVTLAEKSTHTAATPLLVLRMSADAFTHLLAVTNGNPVALANGAKPQNPAAILKAGGAKEELSNFDLGGNGWGVALQAHLETTSKHIASPNILGILPGTDPVMEAEYVVIAAHLDGYGYGTPVVGDNLYNGTLDDAAYVALLIQMADDIKAGKLPRPKRSILFCAFTGEEKGLLGSNWFVDHLTVAKQSLVADVNLDQLRPLFPLNILTAIALDESTLGATARSVAAPMHIEIRPDREPERNLLRRADQYPFLRIHVPAISFVFGYDSGTDAERRYREWYQVRYHRPQDDLTQPVDFDAAAKFDQFFYHLVETIANAPEHPTFLPGSTFAATR